MFVVLGTEKTEGARLSWPWDLFAIRNIDGFSIPVASNTIEFHKLENQLAHWVITSLFMIASNKMQDHTKQQERSNSACIGFVHLSDFEGTFKDKDERLKLRINFSHSLNMLNLSDTIRLVYWHIELKLGFSVNEFNQRHLWFSYVLNLWEYNIFLSFDDLMNIIINSFLFIFVRNINNDCKIDITVRKIQFGCKRSKRNNFTSRVFLDDHSLYTML